MGELFKKLLVLLVEAAFFGFGGILVAQYYESFLDPRGLLGLMCSGVMLWRWFIRKRQKPEEYTQEELKSYFHNKFMYRYIIQSVVDDLYTAHTI
jgi:purine-cytosine permease-like protein